MTNDTKLYIVCGYVASGKTTVLKELTGRLNVGIISTDDLRKELFPEEMNYQEIDLNNSEESVEKIEAWIRSNNQEKVDFQQVLNPIFALKDEAYIKLIRKYASKILGQKAEVYAEAFAVLDKLLSEGRDVIFDATFSKRCMRERAYQVAINNKVKTVYIIQVICSEEIVISRLANREFGKQLTTSNAKQLEIFRIVKREFDESRIQNDNPEGLSVVRIVYDTGIQKIEQFGNEDETARLLRDLLGALSEKYRR